MEYQHLTQKENAEKLRNSQIIGKFGVGLNDALATFDRRRIKVLIKSRHGDITLGKSNKHDIEDIVTLHAYVSAPSDSKIIGTDFILDGCEAGDIEKAKKLFLRFSKDRILETTQYGQVLEKDEIPSKVYMNGVRVAEEENFLFSYNITSITQTMKKALNRERTNVGRTAYSDRIKAILLACKNKEIASKLVADLEEYQTGLIHDELKWTDVSIHACKLLNSLEKVVFLTPEDLIDSADAVQRAKEDGFRIITVPDSIREKIGGQLDLSGNTILDLTGFELHWNESFQFKFVDSKDLLPMERQIFEKTDLILKLVGGRPKQVHEIKVSETMRMESFAFTEAAGLWEPGIGRIIIKRSQLRSMADYAATLLHEVAHAKSGAPDISRGFEQELTQSLGLTSTEAIN